LDEHTTHEREQGLTPLSAKTTTIHDTQIHTTEHLRQLARDYLAARQWSQAREVLMALLKHDAHDSEALIGLVTVYDGLNQFDSLYTTAQLLLDTTPNSATGLAYKARALQKMNRLSEATIANDQALLLDTSLGMAWINRSGLQLLQGKFPEALRSAQRAVDLAPMDARSWANLGVALFNFNRLGEAIETFDKSLELDSEQLFALQMKGQILSRIGRMQEVIPIIHHALSINPLDLPSLTLGIQAFRALEMYDELKVLSHQVIQLAPDNIMAWDNHMRSLRGLGEFEEANKILDHLLTLDASNARYWTMKADTLYRLERYREAVSIAERAKHINPDYAPALRIYEKSLRLMYQRKDKRKV
jgi:tetratricopeptide (TPR) repeat protein